MIWNIYKYYRKGKIAARWSMSMHMYSSSESSKTFWSAGNWHSNRCRCVNSPPHSSTESMSFFFPSSVISRQLPCFYMINKRFTVCSNWTVRIWVGTSVPMVRILVRRYENWYGWYENWYGRYENWYGIFIFYCLLSQIAHGISFINHIYLHIKNKVGHL